MEDCPSVCKTVVEYPPVFRYVVRIWWLFLWRWMVGSIGLGFIVGFAIGMIGSLGHLASVDKLKFYAQIAGFVVGLIWAMFVVVMALTKRYRGFRIALIATDE